MLSFKQLVVICAMSACVAHILGANTSPQQAIESEIAKWTGGGLAVALVSPAGVQFFFRGNATSRSSAGVPDKHTLFNVGPVFKGFTGLLLADQILAGSVSLNDTLGKLLTDWPGRVNASTANITLLELATQSSGIPSPAIETESEEIITNFTATTLRGMFYEWLDALDLNEAVYNEGDVDAAVLGFVLSIKAGKSYEELLKERVLLPLGMVNTTVRASEDPDQWVGNLHSSASDLAKFVQVAMKLQIGESFIAKALDLATQDFVHVDTMTNTSLGWMLGTVPSPNTILIGQSGNAYGSGSTFVGWLSNPKKGVIVLSNSESARIDDLAVSLLVQNF